MGYSQALLFPLTFLIIRDKTSKEKGFWIASENTDMWYNTPL